MKAFLGRFYDFSLTEVSYKLWNQVKRHFKTPSVVLL